MFDFVCFSHFTAYFVALYLLYGASGSASFKVRPQDMMI